MSNPIDYNEIEKELGDLLSETDTEINIKPEGTE